MKWGEYKMNNEMNTKMDHMDNAENQETQEQEKNNEELKEMTKEELFLEYIKLQEYLKNREESEKQLQQQFLRLQADFENFRKRTSREKEELRKLASKSIIEDLLPVLDNLHRALEAGKQKGDLDKFIQGVDMIYSQFWDVLQSKGLECIDCKGKEFDPEIHQAVMQREVAGEEDNIVLDEIQKGYILNGKLIRPSMVSVSKKS